MNRSTARRPRRLSEREALAARRNKQGLAMLGAMALCVPAMLYGAARIDAANGITVSESLASAGAYGGAAVARHFERSEAPAVPARLVGECGGRIYAGNSESSFPAGCVWIEAVRTESSK